MSFGTREHAIARLEQEARWDLIVVTNDTEIAMRRSEMTDQPILNEVRILKLIDKHITKPL